jgi:hypothetical protein
MEKKPTDPDLKPIDRKNTPVVFMFQPTHYKIVPGDKLQEWERDLSEKVGLKGFKRADGGEMRGIATYSWCGDVIMDDCDDI